MPVINIGVDDLPRHLRSFADQLPFAASQALNDTAFQVKRDMPDMMGDDLDLKNKYTAGGSVQVDRASKADLEARVGSVAWYLPRNIEGGEQRPKQGIEIDGKRYLVVPGPDRRGKAGRLKKLPASVKSKAFAVRKGDDLILVVRQSFRGKDRLLPLGLLIEESKWEPAFDWERETETVIERVFAGRFVDRMERAASRAR